MGYLFLTLIVLILMILIWRLRLKKLKTYHSPLLGKIEVFSKYNGEKALTINNYVQGISIEHPSVESSYWGVVANFVLDQRKKQKTIDVLMLGLGANSISGLIAKKDPKIKQTVVEIDSQIIQACKDFFNLETTPNLTLIHDDVYKIFPLLPPYWKKEKKLKEDSRISGKKFNVIIVDVFTGKTPFYSEDSSKPEFIMRLKQYLKIDGVILFNRPGTNKEVLEDNQRLARFLKSQFKKVKIDLINDTRGYRNNIITGIKKD